MTAKTLPLDGATPDTCGAKAGTLATLRRADIDVPDGFVIPFDEYRRHARAPHDAAARPDPLLGSAIATGLTRLFGAADGGYVAVRSSAGDEDGVVSSAAGLHDTVLAVRGADAVAAAVARCWASLHSIRADAYRRRVASSADTTPPESDPAMAVLVQRFIDANVSGVLFTQSPRVIEAIPGLGAPLVGGEVIPDSWTIDDTGIIGRRLGTGCRRLDRVADELVSTKMPDRHRPCLPDDALLALDRLGATIATILGYDADVEWAISGGQSYALQARPITAALSRSTGDADDRAPGSRCVVARGIAASPGRATGAARPLRGPRDFHRLTAGDIIVCRTTDPAWTPLFPHAGGVITEAGGLLSHAAIIARELGIPAVLAVPDALRHFPEGILITIDGGRGTIER